MKIVFMGTPEFAVPVLKKLYDSDNNIIGVVSQPDREKDKKGNILFTPVKQCAISLGIPVYQYEKVSKNVDFIKELCPDLIVTAAYGQLLSKEVLDVAKFGILNVHASILPKYRGSSPIQAAILNGETETGITIMRTEESMDTGDILSVEKIQISQDDNACTLGNKLSEVGAELLVKTIENLKNNNLIAKKQNNSNATYCKKIIKTDGLIDWTKSAKEINNKIRAMNDWPIAYTLHNDKNLKIYSANETDFIGTNLQRDNLQEYSTQAGQIVFVNKNTLIVSCGNGALSIKNIQAPGKKVLPIEEFLRGYNITIGEILKSQSEK